MFLSCNLSSEIRGKIYVAESPHLFNEIWFFHDISTLAHNVSMSMEIIYRLEIQMFFVQSVTSGYQWNSLLRSDILLLSQTRLNFAVT
jgi:hypothetical protein